MTRYTEGVSHFVTYLTAQVASGRSEGRVELAPTGKAPPYHGAHPKPTFIGLCDSVGGDRKSSLSYHVSRSHEKAITAIVAHVYKFRRLLGDVSTLAYQSGLLIFST